MTSSKHLRLQKQKNKLANKTKKQINRHKEQTTAGTPLWRGSGEGRYTGREKRGVMGLHEIMCKAL